MEILFRGKRVDNGEWVEGLIQHGFDGDINIRTHEVFEDKEYFTTILVVPETIGQFTGHLDSSGVKIFDGDKFHDDDEEDSESYLLVEWSDEYARFEVNLYGHAHYLGEGSQDCYSREVSKIDEGLYDLYDIAKFEINRIGNIHKNN